MKTDMRRKAFAMWLLGAVVCFLTGCSPQEEEMDTFVPDADWKPSYETLDALEPMAVSAKTFDRLVTGKTWVEDVYACSDSLGSLVIWDSYNEPSTDLVLGMYYIEWSGYLWTRYQFDDEKKIMYSNRETRVWNYYYNEANGTLAYALYPIEKSKDIVGSRILMMITDKYVIWREDDTSGFLPWCNATYKLYVWTAENEEK